MRGGQREGSAIFLVWGCCGDVGGGCFGGVDVGGRFGVGAGKGGGRAGLRCRRGSEISVEMRGGAAEVAVSLTRGTGSCLGPWMT